MKKLALLFAIILVLALSATVFAKQEVRQYDAELESLNGSGVSGKARLVLEGDQLTVSIVASGFEAGKIHPQHIHGLDGNRNASCPKDKADTDGDGIISLSEGLPFYGGVRVSLTPFSTTPEGDLNFEVTYTVDADDLMPLQNRAIVLHGMTVAGGYVPTLPVACGQITVDAD